MRWMMFVAVLVAGLAAATALVAEALPAPAVAASHFIPPHP
jgi:hypothetical protein